MVSKKLQVRKMCMQISIYAGILTYIGTKFLRKNVKDTTAVRIYKCLSLEIPPRSGSALENILWFRHKFFDFV